MGTVVRGTNRVWLSGKGKAPLSLAFKQADNPLSGFQLDDFDPRLSHRDGLKTVLEIRPNEVQRYTEDDETASGSRSPSNWLLDWISAELSARSQKGKPVELTWKAGSAVGSPPNGVSPDPAGLDGKVVLIHASNHPNVHRGPHPGPARREALPAPDPARPRGPRCAVDHDASPST